MTTPYLVADLERDEGVRLTAYKDSRGIWTIGCGHNIQADPTLFPSLQHLINPGITQAQCDDLLAADIARVQRQLDVFIPWWRTLNDARQDVLCNLGFNLGVPKLATWHHTLGDIQGGRFAAAGVDLENDQPWASQVHARADRLARQMETGVRT